MCGNTEYLIYYVYDETGLPIGLKYRTSAYEAGVFDCFFFEKNLQGDIIAVYNSTGKRIGSYTYDAWGNFNYSLASGNTALETRIVFRLNPFRYRGYYYDVETGLYYLQRRYYNPEWGRFLNADGYVSTGAGMLGYNMFVYANNNPVMFVDPTGEAWWHWALAAAVVVACAAATVATCGMSLGGAAMAISMVASGSAALTTASTVAAAATIGSALTLGALAVSAAANSSTIEDFNDQGDWNVVAVTSMGAAVGGASGYAIARSTIPARGKVTYGTSRAALSGADPNSRYIQYDQATGKIRSDTVYDAYGNWRSRIDYMHSHNIDGTPQCPHMHLAPYIDDNGMPIGRQTVIPWG